MCGIAGIATWNGTVNPAALAAMGDSLQHRGPDGAGQKLLGNNHIGFAHRRLSILDLSDAAAQPMSDGSGDVWLSFNGMISNFRDLRRDLAEGGYIFRSNGDTEVIIAAYKAWGTDSFRRLRGMFAFAMWDNSERSLFLVRDHFGIKPLYMSRTPDNLVFGSEVKALLASGEVERRLSTGALRDFLYYRYVPYERTMLQAVEKIPPATYMRFQLNAACDKLVAVAQRKYWTPAVGEENYEPVAFQRAAEELLTTSVENNLISDVPMGIFLSGGYDSATVTDLATRRHDNINSYSIGFTGWERSEHTYAAETAARLRTRHHTTMLDVEVQDIFEEGAQCYDDPFGGTSFWPTKRLAQVARQDITVALGGDGGDEIFAGYNWYPDGTTLDDDSITAYLTHMDWGLMTKDEVAALCFLPCAERSAPGTLLRERVDSEIKSVKALQKLDLETFLPDVVLAKVDRAAMAHALELRVPFLDPDLVDLVFSANASLYKKPGQQKPTLQNIVAPRLGNMLAARPKQGFSAPLENYIPFSTLSRSVLDGQAIRDDVINRHSVEIFVQQGRYRPLLALRFFDAWYSKWMKGL
ncbi:asparagine synthase (glutamine-hydrolyzing) [Kordiimonas aestuarii]|uniref:asparagine synthase (glutamine-hydrolyzing) n=1 Tax=Kordiimonas aestuarii TaxID=1005925 RepID=UPI0021CF5B81|nr:asparagine synthase (glutamine-hydrolyzing) [Kordiimonas aestuarii]